ncbi:MAG TPA: DNA polymerase III subunit gamma/tau, partial [Trebonia sp.]|nr:DNA polymerase III subunit gamma/tau [Trebonia sp.]
DQLISGGVSTLADASALLGVTEAVLLDDTVDALSARDGAGLFGVVERVVAAGHDPRRFGADLLERLRDLVLLQAVPEAAERGLVDGVPPDQLDRMRRQAESLGAAELSRAADIVHDGLVEMRGTTSPRLLLELVCARLLLPAADGSSASTLARLDAVERRISLGAHAGPALSPAPGLSIPASAQPAQAQPAQAQPAPAPPPAPPPVVAASERAGGPRQAATTGSGEATGQLDAAALREAWALILDAVKKRSRVPHAMLAQHAQVSAVDGDRVTISIGLAPIARQFQAGPGVDILADALTEVVGGSWRVQVATGSGGTQPASAVDAAPPVAGFAPGDEPEPDDPAGDEENGRVGTDRSAGPDPVSLLQDAFGATVIAESDES